MSKSTADTTIGVDLGDQRSAVCVLAEGRVVTDRKATVRTTRRAFQNWFAKQPRSRVVIETGTHSPWVSDLIESLGHEVVVANARQVQLISKSHRKTDRRDAELLARLGASDPELLSPIKHRGRQARIDRTTLRARDGLVAARTQLINMTRGLLKSGGESPPRGCSTRAFTRRVREADLPEELLLSVAPILEAIDDLNARIADCDRLVEELSKRYPETERLRQVPGVGPLTSLAFVLAVEDPSRFESSRRVGSYFGLVPRNDASGKRDPELRITKAGDGFVRKLLTTASQYILGPHGPDTALQRWGLRLAARGEKNAKKRAVTAVARKLAVLLHRLWVTGEDYEPLRGVEA